MPRPATASFHCLIRTHHITSRRKLQRVKKAAVQLGVARVLVRSGGSPGIMFAEGSDETALANWVSFVQGLRYKDFQCVRRPTLASQSPLTETDRDGFHETDSVAGFARHMESRGLTSWWRKAMNYESGGK